VDSFGPDYVVISDTWNMKPHLAEAMRGYPTLLMEQAQECLCPLNNLRLIGIGPTQVEQCPRNQLATPQVCHQCLAERGHHAGALHQAERALAGVGTAEYDRILRQSFFEAEAVLVLNPITAAMLEPYAKRVCVVPWGIDPSRFESVVREGEAPAEPTLFTRGEDGGKRVTRLFMAAVAGEVIKGFHVAHQACQILRETRNDFELVVTFDPPGPIDEFTRSVGWCSQAELPEHYRAADICVVPTIAQDALSITSVEAMAAGKPVVASRIGGLPYTVNDGLTGLLFEPGNPFDLAEKIGRLLDDPALRRRMGLAGRARFEEDFMWEDVIKRYWRPLLPPLLVNSRKEA
jgi:glycosyltransferase involved in cell wall biosynthesis